MASLLLTRPAHGGADAAFADPLGPEHDARWADPDSLATLLGLRRGTTRHFAWDTPDEVRRDLDVLSECALVLEGGAVHETRDMVADLHVSDVLPDLHDRAGVVAAQDASGDAEAMIDIYTAGVSASSVRSDSLFRENARFQSVGF